MDLHQIRAFVQVARRQSFSRAAEDLHLSQPAVSRQVDALERALGVRLLAREGRRATLTEAGRALYDYAERLLTLADKAVQAVEEIRHLRAGRFVLAASTTPGNYILPAVLAAFRARYPGVETRLEVHPSGEVERLVSEERADLGCLAGPVRSAGLFTEPYLDDELVLVAPPGHRLAGRPVTPADLRGECFLWREPASATRRTAEAHLERLDVAPARRVELGNSEAIKRAAAAGMGLAYLSRAAVAAELRAGDLVALAGPHLAVRRQFHFAWPKGTRPAPAALAFAAFARKFGVPRPGGVYGGPPSGPQAAGAENAGEVTDPWTSASASA